MTDMGIAVTTIKEAHGHSCTKVTERYVHAPPNRICSAWIRSTPPCSGRPRTPTDLSGLRLKLLSAS
jgi:hypothetical protein